MYQIRLHESLEKEKDADRMACRIRLRLIFGLTIWRAGVDAIRTKQRIAVAADTIPYCRTPDRRRLPAVLNRGKRRPPCRQTADPRRCFGGILIMMEWLTPMATRLHERWRTPSSGAIGVPLRALPFA